VIWGFVIWGFVVWGFVVWLRLSRVAERPPAGRAAPGSQASAAIS